MRDMDQLTEAVIGAAIEVHRHLGSGFQERTYERALSVELRLRGIAYQTQVMVNLDYKGENIGDGKIDLLVEGCLVVELKAVSELHDAHKNQVLAYLKATEFNLGLLINFHAPTIKDGLKRVILSQ